MICVIIIHCVRIISIANILGGFIISDILSLLKTNQIVNDNSVMSDRYIYLYCHLYKVPIVPCAQDITLNHFAYLEVIKNYQQTLFVKTIMVIVVKLHIAY